MTAHTSLYRDELCIILYHTTQSNTNEETMQCNVIQLLHVRSYMSSLTPFGPMLHSLNPTLAWSLSRTAGCTVRWMHLVVLFSFELFVQYTCYYLLVFILTNTKMQFPISFSHFSIHNQGMKRERSKKGNKKRE